MVVGDDTVLSNLLRATVVHALSAPVGLNSFTLSGSNVDEYHRCRALYGLEECINWHWRKAWCNCLRFRGQRYLN